MSKQGKADEYWGPRLRLARGEEPNTLTGRTTERLRQDIIRNKLKPGARLLFEQTQRDYGVGVSPLREALFQLAAQGLVVQEGHKGFFVAPVIVGEMLDVSSLRATLETTAIKASIAKGGEDWEVGLVGALHRLRKASTRLKSVTEAELEEAENDWEQCHRQFHFALCSACGSPWLLHFFEELYDQLERYRRHFWRYRERALVADQEHEAIMKAALDRNVKRATKLLKEHFRSQAETTIEPLLSAQKLAKGRAGAR